MKRYIKYALSLLLAAALALCPCLIAGAEGEGFTEEASSAMLSALSKAAKADIYKKAKQVDISVENAESGREYPKVLDGDDSTYVTFNGGGRLSITSEQAFENIYLKFELPCKWTLTLIDGMVLSGGQNGFIHEYMPLEQSLNSVELTLPKGAMLTDVYAFTDGKPPAWVQVWEPPCKKADLLVLPTHADDEYLWFGGAMPYYAGELGYEVQVVYMTNHDNATYRNHERLNGLWTVGVTHYPVIGKFRDVLATKGSLEAAQSKFGYDKVLKFQVEILRRFSPRVVIAHDIKGEYGHGAHKLNAKTLLEALELTDDLAVYSESAEKYGTCNVQKCYLHLWKENRIVVDWNSMILKNFDGRTALDMAKAGFACHKSQTKWFSMEKQGVTYDCRCFGLAYTTVGNDTEGVNDMFENVDWSDKISAQEGVQTDGETADTAYPENVMPVSGSDRDAAGIAWNYGDLRSMLPVVLVMIMIASAVVVCIICFKRRK